MGSSLIAQLAQQSEKLKKERGLKLKVVGIASGANAMFDREGISLENCREQLAHSAPSDLNRLRDEVIGMNIFNSVFVDCTASSDGPDCIREFLEHNISVVAANKAAASSDYATYQKLKSTARQRGGEVPVRDECGEPACPLSVP